MGCCLVEVSGGNLSVEFKSWFYGLVSTVAVVFLAFAGWVAISVLTMQQEVATIKAQTPMQEVVMKERFKRLEQKLDALADQQMRLQAMLESHMKE